MQAAFGEQINEQDLYSNFERHLLNEIERFSDFQWKRMLENSPFSPRFIAQLGRDPKKLLDELLMKLSSDKIWIKNGKPIVGSDINGLRFIVDECSKDLQDEFTELRSEFEVIQRIAAFEAETLSRVSKLSLDQVKPSDEMKPSYRCYELVKKLQSCSLQAYVDVSSKILIGWGFRCYFDYKPVKLGDKITQEEADFYLQHELNRHGDHVRHAIFPANINQNQLDALTSFTYNIGISGFKNSTLLKKLLVNPNDPEIRDQFMKWVYSNKKFIQGLKNRRIEEANLYFEKPSSL